MVLRQFLYLNEQLVDEFLAQLEGGLIDQVDERTETSGARRLAGRAGVGPISAEGGVDRNSKQATDLSLRLTPEARFDRLFQALEAAGELQPLQALDDSIWDQLRRGEVIEVEAAIKLSGTANLMQVTQQIEALLPIMDALGAEVDQEAKANIKLMGDFSRLTQGSSTTPVIAEVLDTPRFKFVAHLEQKWLRAEPQDLAGEGTLLCKITRILKQGQQLSAGELMPAWEIFPRGERRKLERSIGRTKVGTTEIGEFSVKPPAALVAPVAVYR